MSETVWFKEKTMNGRSHNDRRIDSTRAGGEGMPRRVTLTKAGSPSTIAVQSMAMPNPSKGEIRIEVAFAGINFAAFEKWIVEQRDMEEHKVCEPASLAPLAPPSTLVRLHPQHRW